MSNLTHKRKYRIAAFLFLLVLLGITVLGCSQKDRHESSAIASDTVSPVATAQPSALPLSQSIRSLDFANFVYPARYMFTTGDKDFTLREGKFAGDNNHNAVSLAFVNFGDVTNDGDEEAMVTLAPVLNGSATSLVTYIYALKKGQPSLLWVFRTGDRADGGLRRVYSENGQLVIERFSPDGSNGTCCPVVFTKQHYAWNGKQFQTVGPVETLANPSGNAETIAP